jgi:hypothetical protein
MWKKSAEQRKKCSSFSLACAGRKQKIRNTKKLTDEESYHEA